VLEVGSRGHRHDAPSRPSTLQLQALLLGQTSPSQTHSLPVAIFFAKLEKFRRWQLAPILLFGQELLG
nr:ORF 4 [Agrobacterium tumefaciens]